MEIEQVEKLPETIRARLTKGVKGTDMVSRSSHVFVATEGNTPVAVFGFAPVSLLGEEHTVWLKLLSDGVPTAVMLRAGVKLFQEILEDLDLNILAQVDLNFAGTYRFAELFGFKEVSRAGNIVTLRRAS